MLWLISSLLIVCLATKLDLYQYETWHTLTRKQNNGKKGCEAMYFTKTALKALEHHCNGQYLSSIMVMVVLQMAEVQIG